MLNAAVDEEIVDEDNSIVVVDAEGATVDKDKVIEVVIMENRVVKVCPSIHAEVIVGRFEEAKEEEGAKEEDEAVAVVLESTGERYFPYLFIFDINKIQSNLWPPTS